MVDLRAGLSGLTALLVLGALSAAFPSMAGDYWYIPGQVQPGVAGTLDPNAHPEVSGRSASKLLDPNAAPAAASPANQPIQLQWGQPQLAIPQGPSMPPANSNGFGLQLDLEQNRKIAPGAAPKIVGGEQKPMCVWYADAGDEHRCNLGPMGAMVPTGGPCRCPRGRAMGVVQLVPMWLSER